MRIDRRTDRQTYMRKLIIVFHKTTDRFKRNIGATVIITLVTLVTLT